MATQHPTVTDLACTHCGQQLAELADLAAIVEAFASHRCPSVYLLHFTEPIGNPTNPRGRAQHYIGWSPLPAERIAKHTAGNGAAIMRAVQARGIGFTVALVVPGTRATERRMKARHQASDFCPLCTPTAGAGDLEEV